MIDDPTLRCTVTALLATSAAGYLYVLAAQHRRWPYTVKQLLHLAMAVAMIAMVWPAGMAVPARVPTVFFLLVAGWFAFRPGRPGNGYHAVMAAAMAWMYAVTDGSLTATPPQWFAAVDWTAAGGFGTAALWWLYRYSTRRGRPARLGHTVLLCQALMGAGAAVMFGAMP